MHVKMTVSDRFREFILAIAMLLSICGCNNNSENTAAGASEADQMLRRVIVHDGVEREFFVHVPAASAAPPPLVLAIHGYTSTATGFEKAYNLNAHADRHGYMVVYPQGSHFTVPVSAVDSYRVTSWNDLSANQPPRPEGPHCVANATVYPCPPECGACDRCDWTSCYDDVGFITRVLDEVQAEFNPDPRRIYLLGVSNGGMMALRLGCNLPGRFAAVAPIIAQLAPGYACGPMDDLPMLHLYGGQDDTVRADGQPGSDGFVYTSAELSTATWAASMSCDAGPFPWENEYSRAIGLSCSAYSDCARSGGEVVSCMDADGGHDWPGQRVTSQPATCVTAVQAASMPGQLPCPETVVNAPHAGMDLVWNFFSRYRLVPDSP